MFTCPVDHHNAIKDATLAVPNILYTCTFKFTHGLWAAGCTYSVSIGIVGVE